MPLSASDPIPPPVLTLRNCLIRPYHPSDAAHIPPLANDPLVARFMRATFPSPYDLSASESWVSLCLSKTPCYEFLIIHTPAPDDSTHRVAGGIGLSPMPESEGKAYQIGYWLGQKFWGARIASEACAGLTRWAFSEGGIPGLVRVQSEVYSGNWGSVKVLERAGYVLEGTLRKGACKGGEMMDVLMYGVLREDLEAVDRGRRGS